MEISFQRNAERTGIHRLRLSGMIYCYPYADYRKTTSMTIQKRSIVIGLIVLFLAMLYGIAKFNSPFLVEYIVEQTLIQKAPPGTDPAKIHERLQELLAQAQDRRTRIDLLFRISRHLEKVQTLSHQDLSDLLEAGEPGASAK
jgi:hypothetical protein